MVKNEWYKIVCKKRLWIVVLVCLVLKCVYSAQVENVMPNGFNDKVYRYYLRELEGEYTEEKHQRMTDEYERLLERTKNQNLYREQYTKNEITEEEYQTIRNELAMAVSRIPTITYILEKSEYLKNIGDGAEYFYDIAVTDYLQNMKIDVFMILVIVILISVIFTEDYDCGTVLLLKSSARGRGQLFNCRLGCVVAISAVCGLIFPLAEFLVKLIVLDLGNLGASVLNLSVMAECELTISIGMYIFLSILLRMIYGIILGMIVMTVAQLSHQTVVTYLVAFGLVYLPDFLYTYMGKFAKVLTLGRGMGAYRAFVPAMEVLGLPSVIFGLLVHIVLSVGLVLVTRWSFVKRLV